MNQGRHCMSAPGIVLVANKAGCLDDFSASLMPLPEFEAALRPAMDSELPLFVVLSASNRLWESRLDELDIAWGVCPDAQQGVDHCVAFGVHSNQDWNGWLIDLARSPGASTCVYKALAGSISQFPIASAQGTAGNRDYPIAFQSRFGFSLMNPGNNFLTRALATQENKSQLLWLNLSLAQTVDDI